MNKQKGIEIASSNIYMTKAMLHDECDFNTKWQFRAFHQIMTLSTIYCSGHYGEKTLKKEYPSHFVGYVTRVLKVEL